MLAESAAGLLVKVPEGAKLNAFAAAGLIRQQPVSMPDKLQNNGCEGLSAAHVIHPQHTIPDIVLVASVAAGSAAGLSALFSLIFAAGLEQRNGLLHVLLQVRCIKHSRKSCAAGLEQKDVVFKVSSRTVLSAILESFGVPTGQVPDVFLIIDKMDKMPKEEVSLAWLNVCFIWARCRKLHPVWP